jgi:hypothetical protein
MKRKHAKKVSEIIAVVILAIFCVLNFSSVQTISTAYAQGQTATGEPAKIKELLLRQRGWDVDWRGPGGSGDSVILFESRGEKIVAKITVYNPPNNTSCEREVIISSDVVKLDGCRDKDVKLQFDPNDQVYPFKGKSPAGFEWKLKAK